MSIIYFAGVGFVRYDVYIEKLLVLDMRILYLYYSKVVMGWCECCFIFLLHIHVAMLFDMATCIVICKHVVYAGASTGVSCSGVFWEFLVHQFSMNVYPDCIDEIQ